MAFKTWVCRGAVLAPIIAALFGNPWIDSAAATGPVATSSPSDPLAGSSRAQIMSRLKSDQEGINAIVGKKNAAIKTEAGRTAAAPRLLPLIRRTQDDLDALAGVAPQTRQQVAGSHMQLLALMSILGDKDASGQIAAMVASKDLDVVAQGKAHQLMARFYILEDSEAGRTALAEDLEKLDRANPRSVIVAQATVEIGHEIDDPVVGRRITSVVADVMDNDVSTAVRRQLAAKKDADDRDAKLANKPLELSGTLVDGTIFSTSSLKGKVILIDFWATWCGPCKEELPRVKGLYDQYHSKGLEVVGVSNDYEADDLKRFVEMAKLPWPNFFDVHSAGLHRFNSLTMEQKLDSIPVMYLIDKKGVLRTVNARENMEELIPKLLDEPG